MLKNMKRLPEDFLSTQKKWQQIQKHAVQKIQNMSEPQIRKVGKLLSEGKYKQASERTGIPEEELKSFTEDVAGAAEEAQENIKNENVSQKQTFEKFKKRLKKAMDDFAEKKRTQKKFQEAKDVNAKAQQKEIEKLQKKTNKMLWKWGRILILGILGAKYGVSAFRPQSTINKFAKKILGEDKDRHRR